MEQNEKTHPSGRPMSDGMHQMRRGAAPLVVNVTRDATPGGTLALNGLSGHAAITAL
jgi:hypothetical protein